MKLTLPEKRGFLMDAYYVALGSPDPSSQNGAVLLDKNYFPIIRACNKPPPGTRLTDAQLNDRDTKLFNIEHAERNVIYRAARLGHRTEGTTLVCPWFACSECSKCIILCGIKHIIGHKQRMDHTPDRWKASIAAAFRMFDDNGVTYEFIDDKLGCAPILADGELWYP